MIEVYRSLYTYPYVIFIQNGLCECHCKSLRVKTDSSQKLVAAVSQCTFLILDNVRHRSDRPLRQCIPKIKGTPTCKLLHKRAQNIQHRISEHIHLPGN